MPSNFIGKGQFETLKRGEFIVNTIFDGDTIKFKEVASWIREKPFRTKKIKGHPRPVSVCTFKELYEKIHWMWTLLPKEGSKRYTYLIQMEEYYNTHKPKNLERI